MLLGNRTFQKKIFHQAETVLRGIQSRKGSDRTRNEEVNRALLDLIQKEKTPCFLLAQVLDFIQRVDQLGILEHYRFSNFELWLNQESGLSFEENLQVRGKIVGKKVDRSDYQAFFPVGMGKVYEGTHFVTAHKSPDLDTTIASFWGWVDAFGAKVGSGLHIWNLPGGPPTSQIEIQWIFNDLFGPAVFTHLPKMRNVLNLTGNDLMSRSGMVLKTLTDSISGADHERDRTAVVVVDEEGFYLGDWRSIDVEEVRQVIILLSSCLRWFENHLNLHLISLFAREKLQLEEIKGGLVHLFSMPVKQCEPARDFTPKQSREVSHFISRVLQIDEGLSVSFERLGAHLARFASVPFESAHRLIETMSALFGSNGSLIEHRPQIFSFLEVAVRQIHEAIVKIRNRLEKLDIALQTKTEVFGHHPTYVTGRSDVEEIRQKMDSYVSLTVTHPDQEKLFPLGVIHSQDLRKTILGTVSLRDFCNREEMSIPPYLDVISVIDHHKSQIQTGAPPFAVIADAQSSNTLVARQAFLINDQYSLRGQTPAQIEQQIEELRAQSTPAANRLLQRLFHKRNLCKAGNTHFIHEEREYIEYLHFLYGILDDTDLLSKVTALDVECIVSLLNRMKSLMVGKEVEVIALDEIPKDRHFPKKGAERILQCEEMYSLYSKVYAHREKEVGDHILLAAQGKPSHFFADTKVQNGCCRIGQTKMFVSNISLFSKHAEAIEKGWVEESARIQKENPEIDLHIHMVSTIVSAEEVYKGTVGNYPHKDELWIWTPPLETAVEHLKRFLSSFQESPGLKDNPLEVEFVGSRGEEYKAVFKESFLEIPSKMVRRDVSFVILRYKAGSLNSRKAMISPFLPAL